MTCTACGAAILEGVPTAVCRRLVYVRLSNIRVRLVDETLVLSGRCKRCGGKVQLRDPATAMVKVSEIGLVSSVRP